MASKGLIMEIMDNALAHRFPVGARGTWRLEDFLSGTKRTVTSRMHTFVNPDTKIIVTLIPISHVAHPRFWYEVDKMCSQHSSVLMEGVCAPKSGDIMAIPPREMVRIDLSEDSEGWEPDDVNEFRQRYSWGVIESKKSTVVHAADLYDYDRLPLWARLRFQLPLFGRYPREKNIIALIEKLSDPKLGYDSFAVPWGAAHMPILASMLENRGFVVQSESRYPIFRLIDGPVSASYVRYVYRRVMFLKLSTVLAYGSVWLFCMFLFKEWITSDIDDIKYKLGLGGAPPPQKFPYDDRQLRKLIKNPSIP
eukprot:PhF_6_TR38142/c0_g1_i1/m.56969